MNKSSVIECIFLLLLSYIAFAHQATLHGVKVDKSGFLQHSRFIVDPPASGNGKSEVVYHLDISLLPQDNLEGEQAQLIILLIQSHYLDKLDSSKAQKFCETAKTRLPALEEHIYFLSVSNYTYGQYEKYPISESIILDQPQPLVIYTVFLGCGDAELDSETDLFSISGSIVYSNPWGYLSAESKPLLIIYLLITLVHSLVLIIWIFRLCKFKKSITPIHVFITITAIATAVMYLMHYVEYDEVNKRSSSGVLLITFRIIFSITCALLARLLALLVFLGYKITKQSLNSDQIGQIVTLSVFFVLAMAAHQIVVALKRHMMLSNGIIWATLIAYYTVSCIFFVWIFLAYLRTREELERYGQKYKLDKYKKFVIGLMVGVCGAVIVGICDLLFQFILDADKYWNSEWCILMVWELLYLLVLWWTMIVFPPSLKSKDFASMQELHEETQNHSVEMRSNRVRQDSVTSSPAPKLGEEVFMS